MNTHPLQLFRIILSGAWIWLGAAAGWAGTGPEPAPVPVGTNTVAPAGAQSVFVIPTSPKQGRDPFFPNAILFAETVVTNRPAPVLDITGLVLNGITSPPRRSAMINGRTFEVGEEAQITLPSGLKATIKCAEITNESAVIIFAGQRRELRLRIGI